MPPKMPAKQLKRPASTPKHIPFPPPLCKTFPKFLQQLHETSPSTPNEKALIHTMRQYEKKFYQDQIKLLLRRVQKMATICARQESQIAKIKSNPIDIDVQNLMGKANNIVRGQNSDILNEEQKANQLGQANAYKASRLKSHYLVQMDKIKIENQKKLRQKQRQHNNKIRSLQFEHHCQIMQHRFEEQSLKKQKIQLIQKVAQLQNKLKQYEDEIRKSLKIQGKIQLQSYKQQNALLRSFIYKVQMTQQRLQKLENDRKKERQQFVVFAEESQAEKRELLTDMEGMKCAYEEKIELLKLDYQNKLKAKQEIIQRIQNQQKDSLRLQIDRLQHSFYPLVQNTSQFEYMQNQYIHKRCENKIEQLRIQRNNIAITNKNLTIRLRQLEQQLQHIQNGNDRQKSNSTREQQKDNRVKKDINVRRQSLIMKSRLSHFNIPEVESKIEDRIQSNDQNNDGMKQSIAKFSQLNNRIIQLQLALQTQQKKYNELSKKYTQLEQYSNSLQHSNKLNQQLSQHSYRELYHKNMHIQNDSKIQAQKLCKLMKQKQILNEQCSILKQKYISLQRQCNQQLNNILKRQERNQQLIYRQRREIQMLQGRLDGSGNGNGRIKMERQSDVQNMEFQQCIAELDLTVKQLEEGINKVAISPNKQSKISRTAAEQGVQTENIFWVPEIEKQGGKNALESVSLESHIQDINLNHQSEINYLKQHIFNLIQQNDRLKEEYAEATRSWKQMFQGISRYSKFVGLAQARVAKSQRAENDQRNQRSQIGLQRSSRNEQNEMHRTGSSGTQYSEVVQRVQLNLVDRLFTNANINMRDQRQAQIKMIKTEEVAVFEQMDNRSEVFTIPDFSQQKPQLKSRPPRPSYMMNQLQQSEPLNRNNQQSSINLRKRKTSQTFVQETCNMTQKISIVPMNMMRLEHQQNSIVELNGMKKGEIKYEINEKEDTDDKIL